MPFRDAHSVSGHIVADCIEQGRTLQDLTQEDLAAYSDLFGADALAAVDIAQVVARRAAVAFEREEETEIIPLGTGCQRQ